MKTYTIYSAEIENPNYTEGADGWPVGTAKKLQKRMQAKFPDLEVQIIDNVMGGLKFFGCTEPDRATYVTAASEILQEL